MASVGPNALGMKQTRGYFVPLGDVVSVNSNKSGITTYSGGSGAGGSYLPGTFTRADWATPGGSASAGALLSSISSIGQGGLLRDMGRTVVSSNRTFRKVQLMTPSLNGGVVGVSTTAGPYLTGYVELNTGNQVTGFTPAPLAYMPGLL
jgi:hypothetical protein